MGLMSAAVEMAIRRLVQDLVAKNFESIVADGRCGRSSAEELKRAIEEYGKTLVLLPDDAMDLIEVHSSPGTPSRFAMDVPLWTAEEGRSDLTLQLTVETDDGEPAVSIDDLHVL